MRVGGNWVVTSSSIVRATEDPRGEIVTRLTHDAVLIEGFGVSSTLEGQLKRVAEFMDESLGIAQFHEPALVPFVVVWALVESSGVLDHLREEVVGKTDDRQASARVLRVELLRQRSFSRPAVAKIIVRQIELHHAGKVLQGPLTSRSQLVVKYLARLRKSSCAGSWTTVAFELVEGIDMSKVDRTRKYLVFVSHDKHVTFGHGSVILCE